MTIARVDGDEILEFREIGMSQVPDHKQHLWRRVEGDEPPYNSHTQEISGPFHAVDPQRVLRTWKVIDKGLDRVKSDYLKKLERDAESRRLQHITPGDGMAMTYREKFEQAKGVEALGEAAANALTESDRIEAYPTLAASIPTEAPTLWKISQIVIAKAEAWADLSYKIEKTRIDGKAAIQAAETVEQVNSAYASITWE